MKTLTLNIKNTTDYQLLLQLAKRLGIELSVKAEQKAKPSVSQYQKLKKNLDSIKKNELFKGIKDPVQWQKQLRNEWE